MRKLMRRFSIAFCTCGRGRISFEPASDRAGQRARPRERIISVEALDPFLQGHIPITRIGPTTCLRTTVR